MFVINLQLSILDDGWVSLEFFKTNTGGEDWVISVLKISPDGLKVSRCNNPVSRKGHSDFDLKLYFSLYHPLKDNFLISIFLSCSPSLLAQHVGCYRVM